MSDYETVSKGLCPGPCDSHSQYQPHPPEQGLLPLEEGFPPPGCTCRPPSHSGHYSYCPLNAFGLLWQGGPGQDGDCPSPGGGWLCTLPAGHAGLHEAWTDSGTAPVRTWQDGSSPAEVLAGHVKQQGADAAIVVDGSADKIIEDMLAAGWTYLRTELMAGKRIRYLQPPRGHGIHMHVELEQKEEK